MTMIPGPLCEWLLDTARNDAEHTMARVAVLDIPPIELYRELVDPEVVDILIQASRYMEDARLNKLVIFMDRTYQLYLCPQPPYMNCYPDPHGGFNLTSESKLAKALVAPTKVAIEWQTTITMLKMFAPQFDARVVSEFFPWIRGIVRNSMWVTDEKNRSQFLYNIGIKNFNPKIMDAIMAQLIEGKPKRYPALTPRVNAACRLGTKLYAQKTMLGEMGNTGRQISGMVRPLLDISLVDPQLLTEAQEIVLGWQIENPPKAAPAKLGN